MAIEILGTTVIDDSRDGDFNALTVNNNNVPSDGSFSSRNKIINGNFDIWQRGTSFSASQYGADRWGNFNIGSSATQSRQAFTLGQTDVPNEPEYFCRTAVTSSAGAGNFSILVQRIEDVRTFAGQTVTLSFWAKADAAKDIAVEFVQNFGTGGSPSSEVTGIGVTTCSLTTSWQKFTVTATLPSIAGKTLGTDNNSTMVPIFWFDAGSDWNSRNNSLGQQSGTFDIAQVQLEAGDVATPFEMRHHGQELALCKRYYQTGTILFSGDITNAASYLKLETFPVTMRASPSIITTNVINTGFPTSPGAIFPNPISVAEQTVATSTTSSGRFQRDFTADAEL